MGARLARGAEHLVVVDAEIVSRKQVFARLGFLLLRHQNSEYNNLAGQSYTLIAVIKTFNRKTGSLACQNASAISLRTFTAVFG